MGYGSIEFMGFIDEIKRVGTKDAPHPRKFCFVLGSGASVTSGIPSGQKLVDQWEGELLSRDKAGHEAWKAREKITDENKYSNYSKYYERRFDRRTSDGLNYMEGIMQSAKPGMGYVLLAHVLTSTEHNIVITTNFDHLTEDAVTYYAQKTPRVIGHESLAHYISGSPSRATIIKIHRDLLFDPKNRSEEIEVLHENWVDGLSKVFENYHPIFIGYAGNDNSLMDFLLDNAEKFRSGQWRFPYWTLYKDEQMAGKVKEFLEKSEGYVVRHNGFDRVMIQLAQIFGYKLPSKEQFLKDAEERHKSLSESFRSLSQEEPAESSQREAPVQEDKAAVENLVSQAEQQKMYDNAISLYKHSEYGQAASVLKELIQLDPMEGWYHFQLGCCYNAMNQNDSALAEFRIAGNCNPDEWNLHDDVGLKFEELNQLDEAFSAYSKALTLSPQSSLAHYRLARVLNAQGMPAEALPYIETAIHLAPVWGHYYGLYGKILRQLGRTKEAERAEAKMRELWNKKELADKGE